MPFSSKNALVEEKGTAITRQTGRASKSGDSKFPKFNWIENSRCQEPIQGEVREKYRSNLASACPHSQCKIMQQYIIDSSIDQ